MLNLRMSPLQIACVASARERCRIAPFMSSLLGALCVARVTASPLGFPRVGCHQGCKPGFKGGGNGTRSKSVLFLFLFLSLRFSCPRSECDLKNLRLYSLIWKNKGLCAASSPGRKPRSRIKNFLGQENLTSYCCCPVLLLSHSMIKQDTAPSLLAKCDLWMGRLCFSTTSVKHRCSKDEPLFKSPAMMSTRYVSKHFSIIMRKMVLQFSGTFASA